MSVCYLASKEITPKLPAETSISKAFPQQYNKESRKQIPCHEFPAGAAAQPIAAGAGGCTPSSTEVMEDLCLCCTQRQHSEFYRAFEGTEGTWRGPAPPLETTSGHNREPKREKQKLEKSSRKTKKSCVNRVFTSLLGPFLHSSPRICHRTFRTVHH